MITLALVLIIVALLCAILSLFSISSPINLLAVAVILITIILLLGSVH